MQQPLVIIGSGLAAYRLLKAFRAVDAERSCHVVTTEAGEFYSKPSLSTGFRMQKSANDLVINSVDQMQETLSYTIHCNTAVTAIDVEAKQLTLDNNEVIGYGQLVLACGASPIRLKIPGFDDESVLSVNQLSDYRLFRERLVKPQRVAILGAGLVGSEFCNDLAEVGHQLQVIALSPYPMDQLLCSEAGAVFQKVYEQHGVQYHLSQTLQAIERTSSGLRLKTDHDDLIQVDTVISAIGLQPYVALAKAAGLDVVKGIVTDQYGRTSAPDVYALGDCAEVCGLWMCYVPPILAVVKALSKTLTGTLTPIHYPAMPLTVKSTWCPTVIARPTPGVDGAWEVRQDGEHLEAVFIGVDSKPHGFILMGDATKKRAQFARDLPDWLPCPD